MYIVVDSLLVLKGDNENFCYTDLISHCPLLRLSIQVENSHLDLICKLLHLNRYHRMLSVLNFMIKKKICIRIKLQHVCILTSNNEVK